MIGFGFSIMWLFSLCFAVIGYICFLKGTPKIILERPPYDSQDIAINIAKILFSVILLFGVAIRANPAKKELHLLFNKPFNRFWNEIFTFVAIFGTSGLAIIFPDIYSGMTIIGGIGATAVSYVFPGIMYISFDYNK